MLVTRSAKFLRMSPPPDLLCCLFLSRCFLVDGEQPIQRIFGLNRQVHPNHRNAVAGSVSFVPNRYRNGCDQRAIGKAPMFAKPRSQGSATAGQNDIVHRRSEGALDRFHLVERDIGERDRAIGREGTVEHRRWCFEEGRLLRGFMVRRRGWLRAPFVSDGLDHFRGRLNGAPRLPCQGPQRVGREPGDRRFSIGEPGFLWRRDHSALGTGVHQLAGDGRASATVHRRMVDLHDERELSAFQAFD